MHELAITRNLVAIAGEHAGGARVRRILLLLGERSTLLPEAVRFCFEAIVPGGPLEGAVLDIRAVGEGEGCRDCGAPRAGDAAACPACGGRERQRYSGNEVLIKSMEVETCE
ncbi:hydrogenase maturation nickel metallochaperone HypA [Frateuria defendens]|uniref:hydrogenase maturation nickel metallochaperone HypA/HybF n=1 Tax=Frateuria defendens TaxID=2219559 RepID=UPI00066FB51D|nr:hydrogenase maturation nickel metallochaperone HypA [Frateuria defendens]